MISKIGKSANGTEFEVILFAGDINVYSVARAFHEAYGIASTCYGMYPTGPCMNSRIIDYRTDVKNDDPFEFMKNLTAYSAKVYEENHKRKLIAIGCGDNYVELLSRFKDRLPSNVIAPYIDSELMISLINKERFYEFCERTGVDYPLTFVHKKEMGFDFRLPFGGPFIIKPSSGIDYWHHPFASQKKVYKENSFEDVKRVLADIYASGYEDSVIIQNFIPGDDSFMRVLTCYSDRNAKVKMMCLGHVLLEEHTPHGLGNHAVIITEYDEELCSGFKRLLEDLHYVGFSNFDIKYDQRDGKFKAFEINTRQGRSNYYVTGSGANIAELIVRDNIDFEELPLNIVEKEHLWMVVPEGVACKYVNKDYIVRMKRLIAEGECCNSLIYPFDSSFKKKLAVEKNLLGHYYKYAKYMK